MATDPKAAAALLKKIADSGKAFEAKAKAAAAKSKLINDKSQQQAAALDSTLINLKKSAG